MRLLYNTRLRQVAGLFLTALLLGACQVGRGPIRPAVTIISPANGAQLLAGQPIEIESLSLDDRGVVRVELWVDGTLARAEGAVRESGEASLSVRQAWTPDAPGRHSLSVVVYNRKQVASEPATILVDVLPADSSLAPSPSPTPTVSGAEIAPASTAAPSVAGCQSNATFVADLTIPDNMPVQPGESFEKVWRMRNSGACAWSSAYTWAWESGEEMGAISSVAVPPTVVGADADLRVMLRAPDEPGKYSAGWRMRDANGQPFGQRATVVIQVIPAGLTVPAAPSGLQAVANANGAVTLTWQDRADNEEGVRIYDDEGRRLAATLDTPDITEYLIEMAPCESDLSFSVRAFNAAGESLPGEIARLHTPACSGQLPGILSFRAEPSTIDPGGQATLSWNLQGATAAYLYPGGEGGVVAPGTLVVSPAETTTYRLAATNANGTVEKTVTVFVRLAQSSTLNLELSASMAVGAGEPLQVTLRATDPAGLDAIWWWAEGTSDSTLTQAHEERCDGKTDCSRTWSVTAPATGPFQIVANARNTQAQQLDQAGALPTRSVRVMRVAALANGVLLEPGLCLNLTDASVGACTAGMHLRWEQADDGQTRLRGMEGTALAALADAATLDEATYAAAAGAAGLHEQVVVDEGSARVLVARAGDGRLALLLARRQGESLLLDVRAYGE